MKLYYQDAPEILYKVSKTISVEVPFESHMKPKQIVANEYVELEVIDSETILLTLKAGYGYDANSGGIRTKSWIFPSLIHDGLYNLMRDGVLDRSLRENADKAMLHFLRLSMARGGYFSKKWGNARAKMSYIAVRAFGAKSVLPRKVKVKSIRLYM